MKKPPRGRITAAALLLQQKNYSDVAKWLLAMDKETAHKKNTTKPKRVDVATRYGTRARGGSKGAANMNNPDLVYEEVGR